MLQHACAIHQLCNKALPHPGVPHFPAVARTGASQQTPQRSLRLAIRGN